MFQEQEDFNLEKQAVAIMEHQVFLQQFAWQEGEAASSSIHALRFINTKRGLSWTNF